VAEGLDQVFDGRVAQVARRFEQPGANVVNHKSI
jgi:hypothetical protein